MIRSKLNAALKEAMKARDDVAVRTLRLILAALKDRDIAARTRGKTDGVEDDEILGLLQTMIKQRREAIQLYEQGARLDLAEQEAAEIGVIETFLPRQMDEAETRAAVDGLLVEIGATGIKDMGRAMAELRTRYAGRMDFAKASGMVKAALG